MSMSAEIRSILSDNPGFSNAEIREHLSEAPSNAGSFGVACSIARRKLGVRKSPAGSGRKPKAESNGKPVRKPKVANSGRSREPRPLLHAAGDLVRLAGGFDEAVAAVKAVADLQV